MDEKKMNLEMIPPPGMDPNEGPPPNFMETPKRESDASTITRRYMDSILIEERLIDAEEATLDAVIFGRKYLTPIMMPAFSHLNTFFKRERNSMLEYAKAAKSLGMLNWIGMCENEEFEEFSAVGAPTVRIIKPYASKEKVLDQIAFAQAHGAVAVGMDVDHIFGNDGHYDAIFADPIGRQTMADLRDYVSATDLPFIVKGVLSVSDAVKCVECGVRGLLISHHHGRIPYAVPPLMVLPEIVKAVGGSEGVEIFVDCSMDTGADAYKALALGANAVAVGRALLPSLMKDGAGGAEKYITKMNNELRMLMSFTGCRTLSDISPDVLWQNGKRMCP